MRPTLLSLLLVATSCSDSGGTESGEHGPAAPAGAGNSATNSGDAIVRYFDRVNTYGDQRCECLTQNGVTKSVDECRPMIGVTPAVLDCTAAALERHRSPELEQYLECAGQAWLDTADCFATLCKDSDAFEACEADIVAMQEAECGPAEAGSILDEAEDECRPTP